MPDLEKSRKDEPKKMKNFLKILMTAEVEGRKMCEEER
jgi:hypothetical protein